MGTAILDLARHGQLRVVGTASASRHALVRELGGTPTRPGELRAHDLVVAGAHQGGSAKQVRSSSSMARTAGATLRAPGHAVAGIQIGHAELDDPHWAYRAAKALQVPDPNRVLPPPYAHWLQGR